MATATSTDQPSAVTDTKLLGLDFSSSAAKEETRTANAGRPSDITAEEFKPPNVDIPPNATKSTSKPATIEELPNELLSHIFGFLDIPQISVDLDDEPTFALTHAETADLKASSCVTKRWRRAILPRLFRHARFIAEELRPKIPTRNLSKEIKPFTDFVRKYTLERIVTTFVLVVKERTITADEDVPDHNLDIFAEFWRIIFDAIDPVELVIVAHPLILGALTSCHVHAENASNFDCPCHYLRLRRPSAPRSLLEVSQEGVSPSIYPMSSAVPKAVEPVTSTFSVENVLEDLLKHEHAASNVNEISESLDNQAVSSPEPSASELGEIFHADLEPWQIHPQSSTLFEIRPWSSLLLNEGSFIKLYSTYEFWVRRAPSILSALLGADDQPSGPLISPTIREMSYIALFPTVSHFSSLTRHLPRLDSLYVQLVPRNNILDVPSKMAQVEMQDLWMERNSCYALLMRELFNAPPIQNYKYLKVFESGDAADADAWHMAVEYVKRAGNGWKVAGDGVFVRDPEDLAPEPEGAGGGEPSSFQGALIRWAWNGTRRLPVSAYPLYDNPLGPVN